MNNSKAPSTDLAPDYYLRNFTFLLDWITQHYADLLTESELDFIARFQPLSHQSQCLFVRLSSRKGQLFRADKLHYAEIDSLIDAAQELMNAGLLEMDFLLSIENAANQLTKIELINLFREELCINKAEQKSVLVQLLSQKYSEIKNWQSWTKDQFGHIYRVDAKDIINTFLLLFFGNPYQDLTEFVLQDLGLFRYENYQIDHQHRIFKSRSELEQYQHIILLRERLDVADNLEQLVSISEELSTSPINNVIARRRARVCNQLAYELERYQQYDLALNLYQQSHLPPARERRIRLLEKQGDYNAAWQLLNETLDNPINEHELQIAVRMAPRLAKKVGTHAVKKSASPTKEQQLILNQLCDENGLSLRVEEIVRRHFETPEAPCLYVENHLLAGLFGLWIWPEMFRSLEGAFANPFQSAPLDMYEEHFASKRPKIADLWQLLEQEFHHNHIRDIWKSKQGISNHFVNWQLLNENTLELALACIPAQHLQLIFERILFDIKNNRSGLPDLIQFFPETKSYRMLEVKGPGDRIQDNQQRWLNFFNEHNIPAEVCYVSWR
jgi:hypothetical protein